MLKAAGPGRWRRRALEAVVIVAVLVGVQLFQTRGLPEGAAPPLDARSIDGQRLDLATVSRQAGGKPVLLAFWATWCPVCKAEIGNVAAVGRDWPLLGVAMQSGGPAEVAKYLRDRRIALPTINDGDGSLSARYRVAGVPTHFVVDASGIIRFRTVGYTTELGLRLRLWWAQRFPA